MTDKATVVTKNKVIAPPERFIDVPDGDLLDFFQGVFSPADQQSLAKLYEMFEGLCTSDFGKLRRALEQDFTYFADAAVGKPTTDPQEKKGELPSEESINEREARFLSNFLELLKADQYKILCKSEWDASKSEDFLMDLPVVINFDAMDETVLPRALWSTYPEIRANLPEELADRALVFHRGIDVVKMRGSYFSKKINLIIAFWILQPVFKIFAKIFELLGIKRFAPKEAPAYMATFEEVHDDAGARVAADTTAAVKSAVASAANKHEHTVEVDRKTFARVFPDGITTFKKLFKQVEVQEACFKDVVVMYRKKVSPTATPGEMEFIKDADPAFLQRNLVVKHFKDIPLADLDMVFPDYKIFMPPQVAVNMAVTAIGGIAAIATAISRGIDMSSAMTLLSLVGGRVVQLYFTFLVQQTTIGKALQDILYERSVAAQQSVITELTEEMSKQRMRELLVAYCILLHSGSLTPAALDAKCESFLHRQYGLKIDFAAEQALDTLKTWGIVKSDASTGTVSAVSISEATTKVDAVWDSIFDFTNKATASANKVFNTLTSGVKVMMPPTRKSAGSKSGASAADVLGGGGDGLQTTGSTTSSATASPSGKKRLSDMLGLGKNKGAATPTTSAS